MGLGDRANQLLETGKSTFNRAKEEVSDFMMNTNVNSSTTQGNTRSRSGGGNRFQSYRYPNKMLTGSTDYLKIKIVKYIPADHGKKPATSAGGEGKMSSGGGQTLTGTLAKGFTMPTISERVKKQKPLAQVILPIPQEIGDKNFTNWGEDKMNPLQAAGMQLAGKLMTDPGGAIEDLKGIQGFGGIDESTKRAAMSALAGMAVGKDITSAMSRATGQVLNPNMETIFKGVKIRNFDFKFVFAPRNESEANQIKQIIRLFKTHSAAKSSSGNGLFIAAPDLFILEYMKGGAAHPYLNVFKPMACTGVNMDYTGNQTYSTYHDGTPTLMKMDISFKELNPIYAEHYESGEGTRGTGF